MTESVPAQTVAGAWVEAWLSVPRFARYLSDISGGRDRALAERGALSSLGSCQRCRDRSSRRNRGSGGLEATLAWSRRNRQ